MRKFFRFFILTGLMATLSACVTHNYENDSETPVVESDSTNDDIAITRISLGMGYLKMGNTEQAKINLEKAKRFAPNLTQVYTAFAHYYETVGEPEQAIESYEKALSIDSKNADTLNNYGVFLCRQGRYDEAEKQTLKAIAIPSYVLVSQSYENLALCELKAHDFEKAETYLEKSIAHSPTRTSSLLQMARLQYIKENYAEAQEYMTRYERAVRNFSAYGLALAYKVNEKLYQKRVAKNYAGMLIKMFPNSYETKQYLLNELSVFEADEFTQIYLLQQQIKRNKSAKKKVVVLSPHKKPSTKALKTSAQTKPESTIKQAIPAEKTQNKSIDTDLDKEVHIIKAGENLFSISKTYNIHMKALEKWNNISRTQTLSIGAKIYLVDPKTLKDSQ